jgi:hypothetical protein
MIAQHGLAMKAILGQFIGFIKGTFITSFLRVPTKILSNKITTTVFLLTDMTTEIASNTIGQMRQF